MSLPAVSFEPEGAVVDPLLMEPVPDGLVLVGIPLDGDVPPIEPVPVEVDEELMLPPEEEDEAAGGADGVEGVVTGLLGVLLLDLDSSLLRSHAVSVDAASNAPAIAPMHGVFIRFSTRK